MKKFCMVNALIICNTLCSINYGSDLDSESTGSPTTVIDTNKAAYERVLAKDSSLETVASRLQEAHNLRVADLDSQDAILGAAEILFNLGLVNEAELVASNILDHIDIGQNITKARCRLIALSFQDIADAVTYKAFTSPQAQYVNAN